MLAFVPALLSACGGTAAPAASSSGSPSAAAAASGGDWQATWSAWQAAAKQEGTVVVFGPPTPKLRETLPPAVKAKLGLDIKYTGQDGGAFVSKLATERAAGTYSTDVVVAGAGSMFQGVAGKGKIENGVMGMLAPLKPKLLLPEVLDPSKYQDNKLWFVDPQGQYVLRIANFTASTVAVNTNVVKPTDIQRWQDLLSPTYTGKIAMYDPTVAGAAIAPTTQLWNAYGQDFLKKLFVDQQPFISRDHRQIADQLSNGSRPVSLFLQSQALNSAAAQGLPVVGLGHMADLPQQVSGGFGFLGLLDHAPHPNAAAVFINWMLSREGQQLWQDAQQEASTRIDLNSDGYPAWYKDTVPKPGEQYFDIHGWDFILTDEPKVQKAMQEMLGRH
ncbi:MAG TPA: extracellular solute-binding protein [Chloroflexota bacterium]|nr:extracellular solute-binding protein [Chloroflexota bacterium]